MQTTVNKTAKTDYQINSLTAERWSPRAFENKDIPDDELYSLFEAARWAPSSMNEQPWRFIYTRNGEPAFDKVHDALMPGNQPWAKKAPVLMVTLVKKTYARNGAFNKAAHHDLGLAIGNLSIQATELGIGLHQMGGFSADAIRQHFDVSDDYEPVTCIALGYFGDPDQLEGALKERELGQRGRKSLGEIVSHGSFNF